jgi:hypothetical protein
VRIENRYPGANPRRAGDVEKLGPDSFLVRPWSEDGDGNYKFCLNVEAVNDSDAPERLELLVDWNDIEYMSCRDYVLLGRDEDWRVFPGTVDVMATNVSLEVPPGEWYLGLHPVYDAERLEDDCRLAVEAGLERRAIGASREGREIAALSAGPEDAPVVLVVARFHPYETAGSWCVSEILTLLGADLEGEGELTGRFRFVVVPVTNPDGVAAGCCKRSRRGGPDLCHEGADSDDPAGRALLELLNECRPRAYLDLHGWMFRDHDGLSYSHRAVREKVVEKLAGGRVFTKEWKGSDWSTRPDRPGDFFMRASRDHGAVSMVVSPSWFGRTTADMREFGRELLVAFCGAL